MHQKSVSFQIVSVTVKRATQRPDISKFPERFFAVIVNKTIFYHKIKLSAWLRSDEDNRKAKAAQVNAWAEFKAQ